jgi:L-rhamnose isomerase
VWDYHCLNQDVPLDGGFLAEIRRYESEVLCKRER